MSINAQILSFAEVKLALTMSSFLAPAGISNVIFNFPPTALAFKAINSSSHIASINKSFEESCGYSIKSSVGEVIEYGLFELILNSRIAF